MVSVSAPEDATPLVIYMCILRGLERLLLAGVLLPSDADTLVKLSVDRSENNYPSKSISHTIGLCRIFRSVIIFSK